MAKRILLGFAEAVPAPEAVFSLIEAGYRVEVFARKGARTPLLSRLPVGNPIYLTAPELDAVAAAAELQAVLDGPDAPDAVFALDDGALWLVNAALEGGTPPVTVINATGVQAELALDKVRQIAAAEAAGLAVPETVVARTPEELAAATIVPAIVKPAEAVHKRGQRLVKGDTRYALDHAALQALAADPAGLTFPVLVQPLLRGTGEGVFGFATGAGVVNWSGHQRVRMMNPHGSGSSACRSLPPSEELCGAVAAMTLAIGWRGPFMIELLRDREGQVWFMELNGRLWGSLALARRAGFEYPAWAVAQGFDPGFVPTEVTPPETPLTVRHLGREILHLLFVLRGPKSAFHKQDWPRIWTSLKGLIEPAHARSFYNYDPAYPGYMWADAWDVVCNTLRRR